MSCGYRCDGENSETGSEQKSEVKSQRAEVRSQKSEVIREVELGEGFRGLQTRSQTSDVSGQKTED